jgi:hypothetical protein
MQAEIPFAKAACKLRHGKVGGLFEAFATPLCLEISILLHHSHREPNLRASQAHHQSEKHRQSLSRG